MWRGLPGFAKSPTCVDIAAPALPQIAVGGAFSEKLEGRKPAQALLKKGAKRGWVYRRSGTMRTLNLVLLIAVGMLPGVAFAQADCKVSPEPIQVIAEPIAQASLAEYAKIEEALHTSYAYFEGRGGTWVRGWQEEQIEDDEAREQIMKWATEVFVRHPEFLDKGQALVTDIVSDVQNGSLPVGETWSRIEPNRRHWLFWDALERFGWEVGIESDDDDAETVHKTVEWMGENDPKGTKFREFLNKDFNGLYHVYQSFFYEQAVEYLREDFGQPKNLGDDADYDEILKGYVTENLGAVEAAALKARPDGAFWHINLFEVKRCMGSYSQFGAIRYPGQPQYGGVVGACFVSGDRGTPASESVFLIMFSAEDMSEAGVPVAGSRVRVSGVSLVDMEEL
jgi:hypothetical protein